jgi:methylglutaconyl-CoA hydratase
MILTQYDQNIATIILNRPEKRNALTPDMLDDLGEAIAWSLQHSARAVLLAGEGPVFCGGFDLSLCVERQGTLARLLTGLQDVITALRALPVPVVIAAHSAAIAGGCALLTGADIVVTDRGAKLGYPVLPLGISPAISAQTLRLLIGDGPCRARLLNPAMVDGAEALRLGLAHELVEHSIEVRPRARSIAEMLAAKPPGAMATTRAFLAEIERTMGAADPRLGLAASLSQAGSQEEHERLKALFR